MTRLPLLLTLALALFLSSVALASSKGELSGVINLNTATADQLELLPGIGPKKVDAILAYRAKKPFKTINDLTRIKGIGAKTFRTLKSYLAIKGETTLSRGESVPSAPPTSKSTPTAAPTSGTPPESSLELSVDSFSYAL